MVRLSALALLAASVAADESCTVDGTCGVSKDSVLLQVNEARVAKHQEEAEAPRGYEMGEYGAKLCAPFESGHHPGTLRRIDTCTLAMNALGFDGSKLQVVRREDIPVGCVKGRGDDEIYFNQIYESRTRTNPDFAPVCGATFGHDHHGDAATPCGVNVALNKPVTCSENMERCGGAVVDGNHENDQYRVAPKAKLESCDETAWVTVDLEELTKINQVRIFGYVDGERIYCSRNVYLSQDGVQWNPAYLLNTGYDNRPQEEDGTLLRFNGLQTVRYVKVQQSRSSANKGSHFLEVEVTCSGSDDCCPETTTTTTAAGQAATSCHALSQSPNRCGPNVGRCNPEINDETRDIYCAFGWCEYYQYYADEYAYDYSECWVEREQDQMCAGEPYVQTEEGACLGFEYIRSQSQCEQTCDDAPLRAPCPQVPCVASVFNTTGHTCQLYTAGQCDSTVSAAGMLTRKKLDIPSYN